jgi:hypothetical protein
MAADENVFEQDLLRGERILWSGQPDPSVNFTTVDIFLVPLSLFFGGFALLFASTALFGGAPPMFVLFVSVFVVFVLYIIFGRFLYKAWKKKRTYYAVTNERVIAVTTSGRRNIQAAHINTLPSINKSIRRNGIGTVKFGNPAPVFAQMYENTGLDFLVGFYGWTSGGPTFYDIHDAKKVYDLVNKVRKNPAT